MPRKVPDLVKDLTDAGFVVLRNRGKGDHVMYGHPLVAGTTITVDGRPGDDAKPYQEKQVQEKIAKARSSSP